MLDFPIQNKMGKDGVPGCIHTSLTWQVCMYGGANFSRKDKFAELFDNHAMCAGSV